MMIRTERHIILNNEEMDQACFLSKNLYNRANFLIRRRWFVSRRLISAYTLIKIFTKTNQVDYRALPSNVAQQVLILLEKNWKSFCCANEDYAENPNKYKSRPKLPKFKNKVTGRNIVVFNNQTSRIKDGYIYFAKGIIQPIKTKVKKIKVVRIIPRSKHHIVEVVYEKDIIEHINLNKDLYLSIDLGVNNLVTCIDNTDCQPFIINGRIIKSINQYYNKRKAKLQSWLLEGQFFSHRISQLSFKRNNKISDYLHKTSRFIINYCLENNIKNIIIGKNKNWKQDVNIGKVNNQKFVSIPFAKLIKQIQYKAEEYGIEVMLPEESYTSKIDSLALEPLKKQKTYLGKRIKRGLFQSSTEKLINADINGAINIARKVIDDSLVRVIINRGLVLNPIQVNCV